MTIKEMEALTGMGRTNIRFYEAEGLICPQRRENGYREYSEADARLLLKIKLLRAMDVPLATVKELASGTKDLEQALTELDQELDRQEVRRERTKQILRRMAESGGGFENLEPEQYLSLLESGEEGWKEDAPPRLNLPWRRYWARGLDWRLYSLIVSLLAADFRNGAVYAVIGTYLAMLTVEPLLLSLFGTTPGKAVFGIRVLDPEGGRLSYSTALERTWTVMWEGEALRIPLISLYFQYKGLSMAEQEVPLSWEGESELSYKDDKLWRYGLYALIVLAEFAMIWMK